MAALNWTDLGFLEETLKRNLLALSQVRPDLARVLESAGVHDSLVVLEQAQGPRVHRLFRGQTIPLQEESDELARPPEALMGSPTAKDDFLSGLGLGERIPTLLSELPEDGRLFVHESDPGLMTLAFAGQDFSEPLAKGRLAPILGAGLRRMRLPPLRKIHLHPKIETLHVWDRRHLRRRLLEQDAEVGSRPVAAGRVAVVLLGELLQEECAHALEVEGYDVYRLDPDVQTPEQIARELALLEPALAFSINFRPELGSLGGRFGFPYVCWEIDPSASTLPILRRGDRAREASHVFTWRKKRVELFEKAGYPNVEFLALAADPNLRANPKKSSTEAPLVFVGSCMREQARKHRLTLESIAAGSGQMQLSWKSFLKDLDTLEAQVRREPCRDDYETLLRQSLKHCGLPEWLQTKEGEIDLIVVAGESLAAAKRIALAMSLTDMGLIVRGEQAWAEVLPSQNYGGPIGHGQELSALYASAAINVDMNRLYQPDIVTLRVFEVAASGGFLLTEDRPELRELFEVGKEVAVFTSPEDLRQQVAHYLAAPEERLAMAQAMQARMLRDHRVDQRLAIMLKSLS